MEVWMDKGEENLVMNEWVSDLFVFGLQQQWMNINGGGGGHWDPHQTMLFYY